MLTDVALLTAAAGDGVRDPAARFPATAAAVGRIGNPGSALLLAAGLLALSVSGAVRGDEGETITLALPKVT